MDEFFCAAINIGEDYVILHGTSSSQERKT